MATRAKKFLQITDMLIYLGQIYLPPSDHRSMEYYKACKLVLYGRGNNDTYMQKMNLIHIDADCIHMWFKISDKLSPHQTSGGQEQYYIRTALHII